MGRETTLFKSREKKSRTEVSDFLHHLADKISEGKVVLKRGGEKVRLDLPAGITLEIKVEDEQKKRKGVQHSLEIELKWYDNDAGGGTLELG